MRNPLWIVCVLAGWGTIAAAQVPGFYGRGAVPTVYEPVVDTVTSGTQVLVQPVVSADRKYVTLSMTAQQSQVISIENFTVVNEQWAWGGWVGGAVPAPAAANAPADANAAGPVQVNVGRGGAVLQQPGMTRIMGL